jgi:zinc D-Ala-D-Ala carboxypeptidase
MFKSFNKHTIFTLTTLLIFILIGICLYLPGHVSGDKNTDIANYQSITSDSPIEENMTFAPESDPGKVYQRPDLNLILGKTSPATNSSLVSIDPQYANRAGIYMHADAYQSFLQMHETAAKDGVKLVIISAFRDFNHQKRIWESKWSGRQVLSGNKKATDIPDPEQRAREILRFSSMPGTSRHHWGTDVDFNSLNNRYFESGEGLKIYNWLVKHAAEYGFCQPYTKAGQGRNGGYEEEKWHWSYLPVSSIYLETIRDSLTYMQIRGFDGWETAEKINVIKKYILDVNADCIDYRD